MQAHLIISGIVQGVGFRWFIKEQAALSGITGWAKNTDDGSVEVVFAGKKGNIENMVAICKKGPQLAKIKSVTVSWEKGGEEYEGFVIL